MNKVAPIEERLEASLDRDTAGALAISNMAGGLEFKSMSEVLEFSKLMALAKGAVPKHLRNEPGACMAVCVQALGWRMDPFAVANKSYFVNDRIAFEAQLVQAVIEQRAPIKGRIKGEFIGEGVDRQVRLSCVSAEDGETVEYVSPTFKSISTKNSPLWKSDPDQQMWYYSVRAMCRRHFPDVLLGVYAKDEIEDHIDEPRDVTPSGFAEMASKAREAEAGEAAETPPEADVVEGEVLPPEDDASAPDAPESESYTANPDAGFPMDPEFSEGAKAFAAKTPYEDNPHTGQQGDSWAGGWRGAEKAAEGEGAA